MKQRDAIAGAIVVLITVGTIGGYAYLSKFVEKPVCRNSPLQTVASPDKKFKAILFERNCGANANVSSQISIVPFASDLPNAPGNAYVAEFPGGKGKRPFVMLGWQEATTLEIVSDPVANVYKAADRVGEVVVSHRQGP